jgi:hypothetical protein
MPSRFLVLKRALAFTAFAAVMAAPAAMLSAPPAVRSSTANGPAAAPNVAASIEGLADQPATHTGFVFDRSMLQAARDMLQSQGMSPQRAAAALNSIAYDHYGYRQPATYAPEAMAAIVSAYHAAGWQHLVAAHDKTSAVETPEHPHQLTDLWMHFSGAEIDGIVVMTRGARNVNLVQVECQLRPLDLVHLGGHFGIPKVDPDAIMVPAPDGR